MERTGREAHGKGRHQDGLSMTAVKICWRARVTVPRCHPHAPHPQAVVISSRTAAQRSFPPPPLSLPSPLSSRSRSSVRVYRDSEQHRSTKRSGSCSE